MSTKRGPHGFGDGLATEQDERGHVVACEEAVGEQLCGIRGRHVDDVDAVGRAVGDERRRIGTELLVGDVDLVALDEPQQFFPRHVERERDRMRDAEPTADTGLTSERDRGFEDLLAVVELHVRQTAVGRDDTLGFTRRTRRIDHVGGLIRVDVGGNPFRRCGVWQVVDRKGRQGDRVESVRHRAVGQDQQRPRVVDDAVESAVGMIEFEGEICSAGPQDREERDHGLD